ncbi:hypothetical protein BCR33DRAFT_154781 [Rhizoclosmatium globosum]|uniref:PhoD-like phosphatase domain-containing protein n=1 Tax=Rhizoclosmatium globosum TaxID=329046 RepID=A0A1Y2CHW3_9FUNG|nr:hypothetical protein BCR33DRAFT_154781 [Rhizoclosmatium globosum]|eukprot:ORY45905.1 hypothetical protein BCR33DRAFT_154781 [Rhizoclosmatium globosum]
MKTFSFSPVKDYLPSSHAQYPVITGRKESAEHLSANFPKMLLTATPFQLNPLTPLSDSSQFRQPNTLGPLLRFSDISNGVWKGSVLVINTLNGATPNCVLSTGSVSTPLLIDSFAGYSFYRFDLTIPLLDQSQRISYTIESTFTKSTHTFHIPRISDEARFTFWSCNGFGDVEHQDKLGHAPMWKDLLKNHDHSPFHIQIGGGDQIYIDGPIDLFGVPLLKQFLETPDINDRDKVEWTMEHEVTVSERYFVGYVHHFQEDGFKEALAQIPYAFVCDDHDIFDGYGSYPAKQQESPVIQNIGRIGHRFYLLFQHHTTFERAFQDSLFPERKGFNWIKQFGPSTLVLGLDNRSNRTEQTIIPSDCWTAIWSSIDARVQGSPTPIKHLYVVATVPVLYPRMEIINNTMEAITALQNMTRTVVRPFSQFFGWIGSATFGGGASPQKRIQTEGTVVKTSFMGGTGGKSGLLYRLMGTFGQPDLRDDLIDEWTHPFHIKERNMMVERLQEISRTKQVRVSFLSGDVHLCGVGRFRTAVESGEYNVATDSRAMYQIISSAIVNAPGPQGIITLLHTNPRILGPSITGIANTSEEMFDLFEKDVDGTVLQNKRLLARRNWSSFEARTDGAYSVQIHVENGDSESIAYEIEIPVLEK